MTVLRFSVFGKPQPAGSKKGFVNPKTGRVIITEDAKNSKPWRQQVAGAAEHAAGIAGDGWAVCDPRPMRLEVAFILARPKGHFGSGRNAGTVRASAPAFPATKPDATKLLRAVEDALTGVVWRDDAQVVEQAVWKLYGEPERVEVKVTVLEPVVGAVAPDQLRLAA
jgi:Holliday junction resolvase RusA-like endonuclease